MSEESHAPRSSRRWVAPMVARDPLEDHRAATPLELFFDLVFVVAIAQAAAWLHHEVAAGHAGEAIVRYGMVFFAIWWAWMNFTWFASAYDNDDVPYRLAVLLQMTGALVLAAGIDSALGALDFTVVALGYVIMRVALVGQWLRASRSDPARRTTAHRYAVGIGVLQVFWVAWLFLPEAAGFPGFFVLAAAELAVPLWAERAAATPWHPDHIVERYGLLTIIVLGETILAAATALRTAALDAATFGQLAPICVGGLLIVFSLWWLYFGRPVRFDCSLGRAFSWGYGHLPIYAAAAAVGAGLGVAVDQVTDHAAIGPVAAGAAVAVPVVIFLLGIWALHLGFERSGGFQNVLIPVFAVLIAGAPFTPQPVLVTGVLTASLLAIKLATSPARSR